MEQAKGDGVGRKRKGCFPGKIPQSESTRAGNSIGVQYGGNQRNHSSNVLKKREAGNPVTLARVGRKDRTVNSVEDMWSLRCLWTPLIIYCEASTGEACSQYPP